MTLDSSVEKGAKDEANVSNMFIKMGYFTRSHIQIYPSDSTQKVSDIDVFGIKFDRYLKKHVVLAEVKSSSNKISDLFKLFGFKTYFNDPDTYFISDKIGDVFLNTAKKLDINAVTFKKFREMTKIGPIVEEEFTEKDISMIEQFLRIIRDQRNSEIFWRYHYLWLELNPYAKFSQIQQLFSKTMDASEKTIDLLWLRKELFLHSFLTHLEIVSDCIGIDEEKLYKYVEDKFFDIGTPKEGKLKIKQGVDLLLSTIKKIAESHGQQIDLPTIEVIPKYISDLVFLIKRTIKNAEYVNEYLKLNDLIYRTNLHGKDTGVDAITKNKTQMSELKNTNDILLRILHEGPIKHDFNNFV